MHTREFRRRFPGRPCRKTVRLLNLVKKLNENIRTIISSVNKEELMRVNDAFLRMSNTSSIYRHPTLYNPALALADSPF